jgi:uncharacterized membrane protein YvbJ
MSNIGRKIDNNQAMKRCPHCGRDYPNETLVCSQDKQPLQEVVASTSSSKKTVKKSDFISLETMLVWAIVAVAIFIVIGLIASYVLVNFGLARDHGM